MPKIKKMRNFLIKAVAPISALATFVIAKVAGATTFSSTSLGTAIDSVSSNTFDYFLVLIDKFWPFLLGGILLSGVIGFGIALVVRFWGKR
jgi:hypothetical protein